MRAPVAAQYARSISLPPDLPVPSGSRHDAFAPPRREAQQPQQHPRPPAGLFQIPSYSEVRQPEAFGRGRNKGAMRHDMQMKQHGFACVKPGLHASSGSLDASIATPGGAVPVRIILCICARCAPLGGAGACCRRQRAGDECCGLQQGRGRGTCGHGRGRGRREGSKGRARGRRTCGLVSGSWWRRIGSSSSSHLLPLAPSSRGDAARRCIGPPFFLLLDSAAPSRGDPAWRYSDAPPLLGSAAPAPASCLRRPAATLPRTPTRCLGRCPTNLGEGRDGGCSCTGGGGAGAGGGGHGGGGFTGGAGAWAGAGIRGVMGGGNPCPSGARFIFGGVWQRLEGPCSSAALGSLGGAGAAAAPTAPPPATTATPAATPATAPTASASAALCRRVPLFVRWALRPSCPPTCHQRNPGGQAAAGQPPTAVHPQCTLAVRRRRGGLRPRGQHLRTLHQPQVCVCVCVCVGEGGQRSTMQQWGGLAAFVPSSSVCGCRGPPLPPPPCPSLPALPPLPPHPQVSPTPSRVRYAPHQGAAEGGMGPGGAAVPHRRGGRGEAAEGGHAGRSAQRVHPRVCVEPRGEGGVQGKATQEVG